MGSVITRHPDYTRMLPIWQRVRDFVEGEDAVKAKTTTYLPAVNPGEKKNSNTYKAYLAGARLFGATALTFETYMGMVFRKEPVFNSVAPFLFENVDGMGNTLLQFARKLMMESLLTSRTAVVTDVARRLDENGEPQEISAEDLNRQNLPYLRLYAAESITNWKRRNIGSIMTPTGIVFQERVDDDSDPFSHRFQNQYRVFQLDANGDAEQQLFESGGATTGDAVPIIFNSQRLKRLPVVMVNKDDNDLDISKPVLLDLVNTNLEHYVISGNLGLMRTVASRPTPYMKGSITALEEFKKMNPRGLCYGLGHINLIPASKDVSSELDVLAFPDIMSELRADLRDAQERMSSLGASALRPQRRGIEAAETVQLGMTSEISILGALVNNVSRALEESINLAHDAAGISDRAEVQLNTDFSTSKISPQEVAVLMQAEERELITREEFRFAVIEGGAIVADLMERIQSQSTQTQRDE